MAHILKRYQEALQHLGKRLEAEIHSSPQPSLIKGQQLVVETTLIAIQIAEKYVFKSSTIQLIEKALVQHLRQPQAILCQEMLVPDLPLWIEIEDMDVSIEGSQAKGFFLFDPYHSEVLTRAQNPLLRQRKLYEVVHLDFGEWYQRCEIIGSQGIPIFSMLVGDEGRTRLTTDHICPWKQCNLPLICEQCQKLVVFWSMWSVVAQKMIEGVTENASGKDYPTMTETIRHRLANPANPKKPKYELEHHTYHIVTANDFFSFMQNDPLRSELRDPQHTHD